MKGTKLGFWPTKWFGWLSNDTAIDNVRNQMRMESAGALRAEIALAKLNPEASDQELLGLCHSYLEEGKISPAGAKKFLRSFHGGRSTEDCANLLHRLAS